MDRLKAWLARPFNSDMNVYGWILLTILLVSVALLWAQVLKHAEG